MMTTCGICGKRFVVTWPQHWVYRRKDVYLCGEDCMIVYDTQCTRAANGFGAKKKEGADEDMALTQKQKNEAVEIAIQGGSPIEYLKKCGLKNPYCAWGCIKKSLEKNEPGKYAKLISVSADKPAKVEKVGKVPEPAWSNAGLTAADVEAEIRRTDLVLQGGVDYQMKVDEATVIRKPYKVTGLETDFGRFTIGTVEGVLRFQASGESEISMVAEDWHKMADVLPEILAALEV